MLPISKRKTVNAFILSKFLNNDWSFGLEFTFREHGKRPHGYVVLETSSENINQLKEVMPQLEYREGTVSYRYAPETRQRAFLVRVW